VATSSGAVRARRARAGKRGRVGRVRMKGEEGSTSSIYRERGGEEEPGRCERTAVAITMPLMVRP
jgi:hypothetical protein